ncbi:MAG: bifunctional hydroxymethylpyrimidine kinase/phosphomethylpyrimidine kinase [Deltaproteobacteria bacterium]|nr:bifunctional hydroxymethylpyrimidine kinase/phosphomethylpyrimidine kinase [Deltaproteobacteria bacterium]
MICVVGEILFDVFPSYKRVGGAPFNFAFHLKNLGFPVRFISRIGNDPNGKKIMGLLEKYRFDLNDIQRDDIHPTGTVTVKLDKGGIPQFRIKPDVAYDYIEFIPDVHRELISQAELVYFGSLSQRSKQGFENVQKIIACKASSAVGFYDINLRPDCYNNQLIFESLLRADVLKLNQEEIEELKRIMMFEKNSRSFIQHLLDAYGLNIISLTRGHKGSDLYTSNDNFSIDAAKTGKVADTVGAGDAYAAMLAAGLIRGMPPEIIIENASTFASSICKIKGAIPKTEIFYKSFQLMLTKGSRKNNFIF